MSFRVSAVLAILATAATTSAAALPNQVTSRVFYAGLEFWGADGPEAGGPPMSYSLSVPVDDSVFLIGMISPQSKIQAIIFLSHHVHRFLLEVRCRTMRLIAYSYSKFPKCF